MPASDLADLADLAGPYFVGDVTAPVATGAPPDAGKAPSPGKKAAMAEKEPVVKAPPVEVDGAELGELCWNTALAAADMPLDTPRFALKPLVFKVAQYAAANSKRNPDAATFAAMLELPQKEDMVKLAQMPLETAFEDLSFNEEDSPAWHAARGYHALLFGAKGADGKISSSASKKGLAYRFRNQPFFRQQSANNTTKQRCSVDKNFWHERYTCLEKVDNKIDALLDGYLAEISEIATNATDHTPEFYAKEVEKETARIAEWRAKAKARADRNAAQTAAREAKRVAELERQSKARKSKTSAARKSVVDMVSEEVEAAPQNDADICLKMTILMEQARKMVTEQGIPFQEAWIRCSTDKALISRLVGERLAAADGGSSSAAAEEVEEAEDVEEAAAGEGDVMDGEDSE